MMTIVQSPDQLPDDEFTKGMITNTQLLYILPTTDVVYRAVEKRFEMGGDPAQCNMMRSIRNDFSGERPHSECFIRFTGGQGEVCGGGAQRTEPGEVPRLPDRRGDMG